MKDDVGTSKSKKHADKVRIVITQEDPKLLPYNPT